MSIFNNDPKIRRYIWAFVAIFVLTAIGATTTCRGAELELAGGSAVIRAPAPVASLQVVFPRQIGNIDLYAGLSLIGDYEANGVRYGNQAVLRAGVTARIKRFGISLGFAQIQHDDWCNSGRNNFNLGLQTDLSTGRGGFFDKWVVKFDHISNAGSSKPNKGRDMLLFAKRLH